MSSPHIFKFYEQFSSSLQASLKDTCWLPAGAYLSAGRDFLLGIPSYLLGKVLKVKTLSFCRYSANSCLGIPLNLRITETVTNATELPAFFYHRDARQQLLLGIRRANRQPVNLSSSVLSSDSMHIGILAAAAHAAANNSQFTVFYNPR